MSGRDFDEHTVILQTINFQEQQQTLVIFQNALFDAQVLQVSIQSQMCFASFWLLLRKMHVLRAVCRWLLSVGNHEQPGHKVPSSN